MFRYEAKLHDELTFKVGDIIKRVEMFEDGWGRGMIDGKAGLFPSNHVRELESSEVEDPIYQEINDVLAESVSSPVVLRRNNAKVRSFHASIDYGGPLTATMFEPEEEPLGPLYGSMSVDMSNDMSTSSLNIYPDRRPGLFSRIRHTFRGKGFLPKFLSGRLSSGSLFETRSACSTGSSRRKSLAAFFKRSSSSVNSSKSNIKPSPKLGRETKPLSVPSKSDWRKSTPVFKLEGDFRKVSLSPHAKSSREPEQSLSWVWQEIGSSKKSSNLELSDKYYFNRKGSDDDSLKDVVIGEEVFGSVDINDDIFEDMFNDTLDAQVPASDGHDSKRNLTQTNPYILWKPKLDLNKKKVQVTEL